MGTEPVNLSHDSAMRLLKLAYKAKSIIFETSWSKGDCEAVRHLATTLGEDPDKYTPENWLRSEYVHEFESIHFRPWFSGEAIEICQKCHGAKGLAVHDHDT